MTVSWPSWAVTRGDVGGFVDQIDQFQLPLGSAVDEQTFTTQEMSRNVGGAATGSAESSTGWHAEGLRSDVAQLTV